MKESQTLFSLDKDETIKALGMVWDPVGDNFRWVPNEQQPKKLTKRSILSKIAKIFDPLGVLAPITVRGKILMQQLWKEELGWDQTLPKEIALKWSEYHADLIQVKHIRVPRSINMVGTAKFQLHGFSDASELAYGAVVYLRALSHSEVQVRLVAAKTRVAPVKSETIARLELCGAVLLAELMTAVRKALPMTCESERCWTDSTIALAWIQGDPIRWQTFVRNRVIKITENVEKERWGHVPGEVNPADYPSRGVTLSELQELKWFDGPQFLWNLHNRPTPATNGENSLSHLPREVGEVEVLSVALKKMKQCEVLQPLALRHSSWYKLCWRTALWRRLLDWKEGTLQATGTIQVWELKQAQLSWIRFIQKQKYAAEIKAIVEKKPLPKNSEIRALHPFIASDGFLRVGGRLQNAQWKYERKHPIILPNHHITEMIVRWYHLSLHHAGPQLLLHSLQGQFWVIRGKTKVKKIINRCKPCVIQRAVTQEQLLADLTKPRVTWSRPFTHTGVDYAGPLKMRDAVGSTRKGQVVKAYVAVFVCFSTKAAHLEVVSTLTTEGFLATLRRFVATRGKPHTIYSDNGTNFIGAKRELEEVVATLVAVSPEVEVELRKQEITWRLNPPGAPHMGGLWEAAVKSMKFHLKRVVGDSILNFEEYGTLVKDIEACMNSRPLCQGVRTDVEEIEALTPGHFLIGQPLVAVPSQDVTMVKVNRLSRWERQQQLVQHFWRRWNEEYLTQLQKRTKWMDISTNITVGQIVVVKEENTPPQQWRLARVVEERR